MRYSLLLHYPEMTPDDLAPEQLAEGMRAFDEYATALDAAGVLVSAEMLQPTAATVTVSRTDAGVVAHDGPRADSPEQLGGVIVIDVPDTDAAVEWAGRAPSAAWGHVEVRPSATRYVDGAWTPSG